jgi:small subunit ribosomal protein S7
MPRRRIAPKKPVLPDTRYGSTVLTKFIKRMMLDGKRSTATRVMYDAMGTIEQKITDAKPVEVFLKALENVKPVIEVKSRRVGGSTYQVPVEIRESRREALAMRWIIAAARSRSGKSMSQKLSAELMDAYNNTGSAFKKKEDTHRMAEANKAFAHYRW